MSDAPKNPFERLTPDQHERGRKLLESITVEKVTVSFSIEDRGVDGRKKSAFYSVSAGTEEGYSLSDTEVIRAYLGRHVVNATYDDAFRRKIIVPSTENLKERDLALLAYDMKLAKLLSTDSEPKKGTP